MGHFDMDLQLGTAKRCFDVFECWVGWLVCEDKFGNFVRWWGGRWYIVAGRR